MREVDWRLVGMVGEGEMASEVEVPQGKCMALDRC